MLFSYTYRKSDGSPGTDTIEAADRAAVVKMLRERGITAQNIREASAKAAHGGSVPFGGGTVPLALKMGGGVILLVVIGLVTWLLLPGSGSAPAAKEEPKPKKVASAVPQKKGVRSKAPAAPVTNVVAKPVTDGVYKVVHGPFGEKKVKVRYSKAVLAALRSANSEPVQDLRPPAPDPNAPPPPPPRYSNNLHIQLSEYAVSGKFVGVPDPMTDKEARRLIEEKVVINADDPEDVVAEKTEVAKMQEELKAYLDEGGHANDYFMKLMERQDREADTLREAKRQIRELVQSGDFELADQTREKFNEYLKGKGLPALNMTPYMKHARAEAQKRKATKAK